MEEGLAVAFKDGSKGGGESLGYRTGCENTKPC